MGWRVPSNCTKMNRFKIRACSNLRRFSENQHIAVKSPRVVYTSDIALQSNKLKIQPKIAAKIASVNGF